MLRNEFNFICSFLQLKEFSIGAKLASAPAVDVLPRHRPLLHKLQSKDIVELENGGYVSCLGVILTVNNVQNIYHVFHDIF